VGQRGRRRRRRWVQGSASHLERVRQQQEKE
jgi:hypothetical protein